MTTTIRADEGAPTETEATAQRAPTMVAAPVGRSSLVDIVNTDIDKALGVSQVSLFYQVSNDHDAPASGRGRPSEHGPDLQSHFHRAPTFQESVKTDSKSASHLPGYVHLHRAGFQQARPKSNNLQMRRANGTLGQAFAAHQPREQRGHATS